MKKITFLISAMATICFSVNLIAQIPANIPQTGLLGWWPFNGNSNDESGNGHNATNYGATLSADRNSVANAAYDFNGVDNYMSIASFKSTTKS